MTLFEEFCQLVLDKIGLRLTKDLDKELEKKLAFMSQELGFQSPQECLTWFVTPPFNQKKLDRLANYFTVGETYFFRETRVFDILKKTILPEIIQSKKKEQSLSIWSAGCCTGEEVYSLAILLDQLLPSPRSWSIRLIGTDINPDFLRRAKLGRYREWSLRSTPEVIKKNYFVKEGEFFILLPIIQEKVEFYSHNLVDPLSPFFNQIDLILCHNVIIYFSPSHIQKVIKKFSGALNEEGWLSVSSIEAPYILDPSFTSFSLEGLPFFKKKTPLSLPVFSHTHSPSFVSPPPLSPPLSLPLQESSPKPSMKNPQKKDPLPLEKKKKLQLLKERADRFVRASPSQEKKELMKVVVFYLNKEPYAIECHEIKEVYPFKEWTPLPSLPPFIKGVMNVRRKILSVIDLKRFFGLSDGYHSLNCPVIILEGQQKECAILTDGVEGIREIFLEEIFSPPSTLTRIKQDFLKGFTADYLLILDGKKLLTLLPH